MYVVFETESFSHFDIFMSQLRRKNITASLTHATKKSPEKLRVNANAIMTKTRYQRSNTGTSS